jgi:hypothetical protein
VSDTSCCGRKFEIIGLCKSILFYAYFNVISEDIPWRFSFLNK